MVETNDESGIGSGRWGVVGVVVIVGNVGSSLTLTQTESRNSGKCSGRGSSIQHLDQ